MAVPVLVPVVVLVLLGPSSALVCPDGVLCGDQEGESGCCPPPRLGGRVEAVMCPDQEYECPDGTTCCQLPDSSWGCCPLPKAVCCEDKRHCCPEGTECDLVHSKCVSPSLGSFPLLEKLPAGRAENKPAVISPVRRPPPMEVPATATADVVCPDRKTACPDETTCCQMSNGTYGCCPLPNAVCCSDHVHCCPANTRCDLKRDVCVPDQGNSTPLVTTLAAVTEPPAPQVKGRAVPCNDSVACADGSTCCKSVRGEWACCPLPEAVCCEDHLHCCPHGTVCNLEAQTCDHSSGGPVTPLLPNTPVFPLPAENRKCEESTSCPGNWTCCQAAGGRWACCPLPQAVCCDDHVHCCPHGSVCDLEAQTCDDRASSSPPLPWFSKVPAQSSENCDQQTACPGGTTCCRREAGLWGCCPLPQAVCCSDREHCCPRGYRCNVAQQTCDRPGDTSVPWVRKVPAPQGEPVGVRIPCDARTSCPKDTTCCFMEKSHRWGCCPVPDAVCCKDGNHCCPRGHTCDPHRSSCSRGPLVTTWFTKLAARTEPGGAADVKCDDKSSCASGTTCCRLQSGEWGCCPLVKAVCCEDHEHCCPQGYTCNMKTKTCEKKAADTPPLRDGPGLL